MSLLRTSSSSASMLRHCARAARLQPATILYTSRQFTTSRWLANAANPKIDGIVDQISQLTLLETADLVSALKTRLNIPDMPLASFAAAPAGGQVAAQAAEPEEEAAPVKAEKTLFNLKLMSFEATAKPKVIKEVKALLGLSLVDSKKFVESAPKVLKESVTKEEAEKIMETMKTLGAVVNME